MAARYQQYNKTPYIPLPFQEMLQAGALTQDRWKQFEQTRNAELKRVRDAVGLPQDQPYLDKIFSSYESQVDDLTKKYKGNLADPGLESELQQLAATFSGNKGIQQAGQNLASYQAAQKAAETADISDFQRSKLSQAYQGYQGIGDGSQGYKRFTAPDFYKETDIPKVLDSFADGIKASGIETVQTGNGYIYKRGKEEIRPEEVQQMLTDHLASDPRVMQQLRDVATYQGKSLEEVITDYAAPYSFARGFSKQTVDMKSDASYWKRKEEEDMAKIERGIIPWQKDPNKLGIQVDDKGQIVSVDKSKGIFELINEATTAQGPSQGAASSYQGLIGIGKGIAKYFSKDNNQLSEKQSKQLEVIDYAIKHSYGKDISKKELQQHRKEYIESLSSDASIIVDQYQDVKRVKAESEKFMSAAGGGTFVNRKAYYDGKEYNSVADVLDEKFDIEIDSGDDALKHGMTVIGDLRPRNPYYPKAKQVTFQGKTIIVDDTPNAQNADYVEYARGQAVSKGVHEEVFPGPDGKQYRYRFIYNQQTGQVDSELVGTE